MADKNIRIPSEKTARKIVQDLYRNDAEYRTALQGTLTKAYMQTAGLPEDLAKFVATDKMTSDPFGSAIYAMVRQGADSKKLTQKLIDAGYDAIEDYFDKGSFSESPLILLDPSSSVRKTGEVRVNKLMVEESLKLLGYSKADIKELLERLPFV